MKNNRKNTVVFSCKIIKICGNNENKMDSNNKPSPLEDFKEKLKFLDDLLSPYFLLIIALTAGFYVWYNPPKNDKSNDLANAAIAGLLGVSLRGMGTANKK